MGAAIEKLNYHKWKPTDGSVWVDPDDFTPSEPPNYGFKAARKERVVTTPPEAFVEMKIPDEDRDYCVDYYVKLKMCLRDNALWPANCWPERHALSFCEFEDFEMRAKEYERERRLRERRRRLEVQNG